MIEVKGVYKQFNAQSVLNDISLTVGKGEVVGFLGRNGAGKSTMLNIITGCLAADSGTVSIGGYDVFEDPIHAKQQMGYLPENPPLYSDMKVGEYLDFVHALKGISKAKRQEDIAQAMRLADITDVENRFIRNLSKGYKQRVGLAGALCSNPQVLILDEPTSGLDPKQIVDIRRAIKGLKNNHTVFLSSHIISDIEDVCDRIIIINKGKVVCEGTEEEILDMFSNKDVVVMTLAKSGLEKLKAKLLKLAYIKDVSITDLKQPEHAKVTIACESVKRDVLAEFIVQQGGRIYAMTSGENSLEQVFMQLTKD